MKSMWIGLEPLQEKNMKHNSEAMAWMVKVLFNYPLHSGKEPKRLNTYKRRVNRGL